MNDFYDKLDKMIPNPKCELNYNKDYELLIAVVLSAQCKDSRVNVITKELFDKYDIFSLATAPFKEIEELIRPLGTYTRKSAYIIEISKRLVRDWNGKVPNDRTYLESLPGVGRKVADVVLANIFNEPAIAVDTHVERVSKRLGLAKESDTVLKVREKLMKKLDKDKWIRCHHQLVLFGRYICKSRNPECAKCLFTECKYRNKKI
ncbi:MAG: endonuclease III [Bacilli bacterium]